MKTQCSNCRNVFTIPNEYTAKTVKCPRCKQPFSPEKYQKPPIVVPDYVLTSGAGFIEKLWKGIPKPFKVGFLTTLGIISAILFCLYIYRHSTPTNIVQPIDEVKTTLAKCKLFPDIAPNQYGILHGRYLLRHDFFPDVNRFHTSLSVYTDNSGKIVGISALWYGSCMGFPAEPVNDKIELYCGNCVCDGILALMKYNPTYLHDDLFETDELFADDLTKSHQCKNNEWTICITRSPTPISGSEEYVEACKKYRIDSAIYAFSIGAHNW